MSRHLAYRRLFAATHELRVGAEFSRFTPDTPSCACCNRRWSEVEAPFQAAEYRYGKSGEPEQVCLTCYTPRIPSERLLGLERYNHTGNTTTPIYGKLGMLVGSGGIITPRNELYLTLPPKLHAKYEKGEWGQQGRLSTTKPLPRLLDLLIAGALSAPGESPLEQGFVYIENWGRKADILMRRLLATTSLKEVWCNSEQGVTPLDLQAILETAQVLKTLELTNQADRLVFWKPITDAARGQRDDAAFDAWLGKVPDPRALLMALPTDPFDRLRLPAVLREVMPRLSALEAYLTPAPPQTQRQGSLF
jgi:hypothetical protein